MSQTARMRRMLIVLFSFLALSVQAAEVTTVILVRHAEKSGEPGNDPPLTAEGRERANELARMLRNSGIQQIFTTNFARTKQTAQPIAKALGLEPGVNKPGATYANDIAKLIRSKHHGRTVLVVGHSNTTPEVMTALGVANAPSIADDEYDNLFIVLLVEGTAPKLIALKY